MPPSHKIPLGIHQGNRPVSVPVRNFWKNTQTQFKLPQENLYIPKQEKIVNKKPETLFIQKPQIQQKEKPFLSSPTINNHEHDFHIQTNSIPTHINTIKQVGEKGPIHTIPAPKLGPQDKPSGIDDIHSNIQYSEVHSSAQYPETIVSVQKSHSYEVTESSEQAKYYPQKQQHVRVQSQIREQEPLKYYHQQQPQVEQPQDNVNAYYSVQPHTLALQTQSMSAYSHPKSPQQDFVIKEETPQLSQKELFQLLQQQYPQDQFESYKLPQTQDTLSQTQNVYQHQLAGDNYQALLAQLPQVYQQDPYRNLDAGESEAKEAEDKISVQPEFHSFNYEEQNYDNRAEQKQDSASFVTASYNIDTAADSSEPVQVTVGKSSAEAVAQAQYIQSYFQTNDDDAENNVEPDAKPSEDEDTSGEASYYSTLPNKETADSLAKLQTAGKINSHLMKVSPQELLRGKNPMTIFVPDDNADRSPEAHSNENGTPESNDYDEYVQDDVDSSKQQKQVHVSFGHRLKPKNSKV